MCKVQCRVTCQARKDLNVKIALWGCVLTPPSGCFTPNCNSETNTSQGKADYTIVHTILHYVCILFKCQHTVLYNKGKGVWKGEEIKLRCFQTFFV